MINEGADAFLALGTESSTDNSAGAIIVKGMVDRALPGPLNLPQIPALAERGAVRMDHAWQSLDADVPAAGWLAGEHFSLADIDMHVIAAFSGWVKKTPPESCTNLHAYLQRVAAERTQRRPDAALASARASATIFAACSRASATSRSASALMSKSISGM